MNPPSFSSLIGVFGGTFDPPHIAHQKVVFELLENPGLKEILVLPCAIPSLKEKPRASNEHRLNMTKLCFDHPQVKVLDLELKTETTTYTFETLQKLKQIYGPNLCFIMGTDQFSNFPSWKRFPDILSLCHWIVIERQGEDSPTNLLYTYQKAGLMRASSRDSHCFSLKGGTTLWMLKTDAPFLSSSQIRRQIAKQGAPLEEDFPPPVREYLMQHSLYGSNRA